ncbi:MAG: ABC transporter ATP-binding protein, partial [Treponema sp.]|nr:ABC transporter ATP-binding protein [Treponema sp.]
LVSHDRYFMDKTVDSLFIMEEDGNISGFVGKCSEYIDYREEKRKEEKAQGEGAVAASGENTMSSHGENTTSSSGECAASSHGLTGGSTSPTKKKLSFKEQREFEELDTEIPALEAEQKALEEKMASSDFEEVRKAGERYKEIEALLEEKYPRWEELAERA